MLDHKAKQALDNLIAKARVHLYKPIQIAEILYRDRVVGDINLTKLETYRTTSKHWRDIVCLRFLGRTSTSSARYQDDLFNNNAIPPVMLAKLGQINKESDGRVEAYIYKKFAQRLSQVSIGLAYCQTRSINTFDLKEFLDLFWNEPGLRRSIDKVYEIIVYSLFATLVQAMNIRVAISMDTNQSEIFYEFEDFARKIIQVSPENPVISLNAKIYRVGVTNAADRGLDMWANFGLAVQVKHLSLTEELAENIINPITSDRIVIVCKDAEEKVILSLLGQLGWKARIQSIVTENHLIEWYDKAFKGQFGSVLGQKLLSTIEREIKLEFPVSDNTELEHFMIQRGYSLFSSDTEWL